MNKKKWPQMSSEKKVPTYDEMVQKVQDEITLSRFGLADHTTDADKPSDEMKVYDDPEWGWKRMTSPVEMEPLPDIDDNDGIRVNNLNDEVQRTESHYVNSRRSAKAQKSETFVASNYSVYSEPGIFNSDITPSPIPAYNPEERRKELEDRLPNIDTQLEKVTKDLKDFLNHNMWGKESEVLKSMMGSSERRRDLLMSQRISIMEEIEELSPPRAINENEECIVMLEELADSLAIRELTLKNPEFSLENDTELYNETCKQFVAIVSSFKRNKNG